MSSGVGAAVLRVLVVDDEPQVVRRVLESLPGRGDFLEFVECSSAEQVGRLGPEEVFDICVFDIRFQDGRSQVGELLDLQGERWPSAIVVVLSNYLGDLGGMQRMQARSPILIPKAKFGTDPSVLPRELRQVVLQQGTVSPELRAEIAKAWKDVGASVDEEVLLEISGYVGEVLWPYVKVVVHESGQQATAPRHLLMNYDLFRAAGILGEDMGFTYRMCRVGNKIISEVVPADGTACGAEGTAAVPAALERLDQIQRGKTGG
jgi:CheY-like chemotaxis protein